MEKQMAKAAESMSLAEVYAFAIEREREAQAFYSESLKFTKDPGARAMLGDLYQQEIGHERMLMEAQNRGQFNAIGKPRGYQDLGLADQLPKIELGPKSTIQEILIAAIKKEALAEAFYAAAAKNAKDDNAVRLFTQLAAEEHGHKTQLETW